MKHVIAPWLDVYSKSPRNASATKAGPGRRHGQGDGTHEHLTVAQKRAGMYAKGLRNWITNRQAAAAA